MKPATMAYLLMFCGILALMHWAQMPFWGGVILFVVLQIYAGVSSIATLLLTLVSVAMAEEDSPTLRAVPDLDEGA